jgi:hypothetical protein
VTATRLPRPCRSRESPSGATGTVHCTCVRTSNEKRDSAPLTIWDVTDHLAAAIQLSNKHIHSRFLEEAETLLSLQMPTAAIVVAGVVLESLTAGQRHYAEPGELERIEIWSQLRNAAVHSHERMEALDEAREMVAGVRRLLLRATASSPRLTFTARPNRVPGPVRGKYKFVPASSQEFIARKVHELRLEH